MKLEELQRNFANQIYNKNNQEIFAHLGGEESLKSERLSIYRNNIFGSYHSVLESTFPVVKKLVGDDFFLILGRYYNSENFSQSGNLEVYGKNFPQFIAQNFDKHKLPYLADLAKLEWLYHLSYFAANPPGIDIKSLQNLEEEDFFQIIFTLHPSCHLIESSFSIFDIWQENQKEVSLQKINFNKKQLVLIERAAGPRQIYNLSAAEFEFLQMSFEGKNIYEIFEKLSAQNSNFDIGSLINKFINNLILNNFKKG